MKPLVSILIPAYNGERWIAETICSALRQTWSNTEIIIVDDGSTDRTFAVARRFKSKKIAVACQENQGAAAARNKAFSLSKGDYIQWLDADDLIAPDKISNQMALLQQAGSDRTLLSCPWGHFFVRPNKAHFRPSPLWNDLTPLEWMVRKMKHSCHTQTATWLVNRELAEAAGPWDTRLLGDDDGEYFCRVMMRSNGIRFARNSKIFYRMSGSNRLSYVGNSDKKMEAQLLSMKTQIGYLLSMEDSERTRAACVNYLQYYLIDFHPQRPDIVSELERIAQSMGAELKPPSMSWKYSWIQRTLGWETAKSAQYYYNEIKSMILRTWDEAMFWLEQERPHRSTEGAPAS